MTQINWSKGTIKAGFRGKEHEGTIDGELAYLVTPSTPAGGRYTLLATGDRDPVEICKGSIAVCKGFAQDIADGKLVKLPSGNYAMADADPACKSCEQEAGPVNGNGDCLPCASDKNPMPTEPIWSEHAYCEMLAGSKLDNDLNPIPMPAVNHATKAKKPGKPTVAERKATRQAKKAKPETQLEIPPQLANGTPEPAAEPVKGRVGAKGKRKAAKVSITKSGQVLVEPEDSPADPAPAVDTSADGVGSSTSPRTPNSGAQSLILTAEQKQERINALVWDHGIRPPSVAMANAGIDSADLTPTAIAKAERYVQKRLRNERDELPVPRVRESAGMTRIIALSGAGPEIEVPSGSPQSVLAWAEAVRDWGESQGDFITALALVNLAGHLVIDADKRGLVVGLIRKMFADELDAERKGKPKPEAVATDMRAEKVKESPAKGSTGETQTKRQKGDSNAPRDAFGSRVGTIQAAINAVLTKEPQTMDEILNKSGVERQQHGHLRNLIKEGKVKKTTKGYCLS